MADYNPVQTPGIGNELKVEPEGSVLLRKEDIVQHQNMVRFLIFFCQCTRVDIRFMVSQAAWFLAKYISPSGAHQAHLVLRSLYIRSLHQLKSQQQLQAHRLQRHLIQH